MSSIVFSIDENGILNVTAEETRSGNNNDISILSGKRRLSKEQIGRMVREAEEYKADDERCRKRAEAKNALEYLIYKIRAALKNGYVLSKRDKEKIENALGKASV